MPKLIKLPLRKRKTQRSTLPSSVPPLHESGTRKLKNADLVANPVRTSNVLDYRAMVWWTSLQDSLIRPSEFLHQDGNYRHSVHGSKRELQ